MPATVGKTGGFYVGSTLVTFIDSWTLNPGEGDCRCDVIR
jgi:hypothetical protein